MTKMNDGLFKCDLGNPAELHLDMALAKSALFEQFVQIFILVACSKRCAFLQMYEVQVLDAMPTAHPGLLHLCKLRCRSLRNGAETH
jgi:hypothetical protein